MVGLQRVRMGCLCPVTASYCLMQGQELPFQIAFLIEAPKGNRLQDLPILFGFKGLPCPVVSYAVQVLGAPRFWAALAEHNVGVEVKMEA